MISFFTDLQDDIGEGVQGAAQSIGDYFKQPAQDRPAAAPDNFSLLLAVTMHEFSMMEASTPENEANNLEEAFNIAMQSMLENAHNPLHAEQLLQEIATNPAFGDPMQREQLIQRLNGAMEHMPEGPARLVIESGVQAIAGNREQLSDGIEAAVEGAIARGVRYGMGAKANGNFSEIDCSGLVHYALRSAMGAEATRSLANHSDGQISALIRRAGSAIAGDNITVGSIVEGTVISIDSGDKEWDRGRNYGVDHIAVAYRDSETGRMMIAESRGDRGVMTTEAGEWLARANRNGYDMMAVDAAVLRPDILENDGVQERRFELA